MRRDTLRSRGNGKLALDAARHTEVSREAAACSVQLSLPMIAWARRILRLGTPDLIHAVEEGDIALHVAAVVSRWPAEAQVAFVRMEQPKNAGVTLSARYLQIQQTL